MTLVVSARVPDGVVIAADSLATLSATAQTSAKANITCPHCGETHEANVQIPVPVNMGTVSTLPNAQKLLPIFRGYGMATYGTSVVGGRTVFAVMREFVATRSDLHDASLADVAEQAGQHLSDAFAKDGDLTTIPKNSNVAGFQLAGYLEGTPATVVVNIGSEIKTEVFNEHGVTVSGDTSVVTNLWNLGGADPRMGSFYTGWSVQDAIDYVKFLISTTMNLQKFATMIPTVGGDIDIAFISPTRKYTWIQRKPLAHLLLQDGEEEEPDNG